MALYDLKKSAAFRVTNLITAITEEFERVSMHGVRGILIEEQAKALDIPLDKVYFSKDFSDEEYKNKMNATLTRYKLSGVSHVAFGDIHLTDLRQYREENLSTMNIKGIFPLWGKSTSELARRFVGMGFKAIVTCVDTKFLDKGFVGRQFDRAFIESLPSDVDPCGENGEFHNFVYGGPVFKRNVEFKKGRIVYRKGYYFCDLLPYNNR